MVLLRLALVTCDTLASYIELPPALCPKPALAAPPSLPGAWRAPELAALRLLTAHLRRPLRVGGPVEELSRNRPGAF